MIGSPAAQEQLGKVHFPVSCSPAAQAQFDWAIAMLHSFFYPETVKAFTAVTESEPGCAMGYWGLAMSIRQNPLIPVPIATLKQGAEAIEKAKAVSTPTQRERDWIAALDTYYRDRRRSTTRRVSSPTRKPWSNCPAVPGRQRGDDLLCPRSQRSDRTLGQDLRAAAQGGRHARRCSPSSQTIRA